MRKIMSVFVFALLIGPGGAWAEDAPTPAATIPAEIQMQFNYGQCVVETARLKYELQTVKDEVKALRAAATPPSAPAAPEKKE
jgi:hypothetical protein